MTNKFIAQPKTTLLAIQAVKAAPCPKNRRDLDSKKEWKEEQDRILKVLTDIFYDSQN